MKKLDGKIAIGAGASKGIGASIAKHSATLSISVRLSVPSRSPIARSIVRPKPQSMLSRSHLQKNWVHVISALMPFNPGFVETEGTHAAGEIGSDFHKQVEVQIPLGRIGQPQDIVPAAVFLAFSDSAWIAGETLIISGGFY